MEQLELQQLYKNHGYGMFKLCRNVCCGYICCV